MFRCDSAAYFHKHGFIDLISGLLILVRKLLSQLDLRVNYTQHIQCFN